MMQERLCENQDVEHVVARGVCVCVCVCGILTCGPTTGDVCLAIRSVRFRGCGCFLCNKVKDTGLPRRVCVAHFPGANLGRILEKQVCVDGFRSIHSTRPATDLTTRGNVECGIASCVHSRELGQLGCAGW
jgi:hypothetical protein